MADKTTKKEAAAAEEAKQDAAAKEAAAKETATPEPTPPAAPEHPEPNRLPSDQLVVTGDTKHPEEYVDHKTNETELADKSDEDNYAGGPEYKPV